MYLSPSWFIALVNKCSVYHTKNQKIYRSLVKMKVYDIGTLLELKTFLF